MGVVRIVVDANWNTGCSDQRVSLDSVRVGNRSRGRVRPSFSACSLPAIQTILSRQDAAKANISVKTTTKMIETMVTPGSATTKIVGVVAATPRTKRLLDET